MSRGRRAEVKGCKVRWEGEGGEELIGCRGGGGVNKE